MRKFTNKFLAILMCLTMILTIAPIGSFAVEVSATADLVNNSEMTSDIRAGETITINIVSNNITYIRFIPEVSGIYTFSSNSSSDTYGYLYDADKNQITYNDDDGNGNNFSITYELQSGVVYYWGARYYDSGSSGSFNVTLVCDEAFCAHENTTADSGKEASCAENGYTAGIFCNDCNKWIEGHEIITIDHTDENIDGICDVCESDFPILAEGTCGTYLTWALYETGLLNITGTGDMYGWTCDMGDYPPWYSYRSYIETVNISNLVTSIGSDAFYECTGLTSITIPDSVTSIGSSAFYNTGYYNDNSNWTDGVLYIGNHLIKAKTSIFGDYTIKTGTKTILGTAFYECTGLTSITIPDSVTSIGYRAFEYCRSLTSITIPDSVTSIGSSAFYNTGYYNDNSNWTDGVLYIGNHLIQAETTISGAYTIKSGTKTIADSAFVYRRSLTSITIPDSVTSIGYGAFQDCDSLTSITIGNSVTSIGDTAFYNCTGLTSVTIPDSVTSIGDTAFYNCTGLTDVYITDIAAWCKINFGGFYANPMNYADNLYLNGELVTNLIIPDTVTSIGDYVFYDCSSLTSITIPDTVTSIGNSAFYNTAYYNDDSNWIDGVLYIGNHLIKAKTTIFGDYTIKQGTKTIAGSAFYGGEFLPGCDSLTSVTIPDSVTSIGDYAFRNCDSLTSITIPDSVTSIGDYAFDDCFGLTSVTIGNSVTSIGEGAFRDCDSLTDVYYEGSRADWNKISIGDFNSNLTSNLNFKYYSGVCGENLTWTLDTSTGVLDIIGTGDMTNWSSYYDIPWYSYKSYIKTIIIGDDVTSIGNYAFYDCYNLTSVVIGNSVTSIDDYAFGYCDGLTSVTIGNSVTSIGIGAFDDCFGLTNITIPDSVISIGEGAFDDCFGLTSVTIGNSVTSIGEGAFGACAGLTSITIPDSVTSIGNYAFAGCYNLTSVTIGNSVTSIGEGAFYGCTSLTSIIVDSDNGYYLNDSYGVLFNKDKTELIQYPAGNTNTSYIIPDSVTGIGDYAFYGCTGLTSITIPDSVTSIGYDAFYDCDSLTDVFYEWSRSDWNRISIGSGNSALTSADIHYKSQGSCGENLFWVLDIETGVLEINGEGDMTSWSAYYDVPWQSYWSSIEIVNIGNSVTSIGDVAFSGCEGLTSITIPDSVESIGVRAFENCYLTDIVIGKSVKSIGNYAFRGCFLLEDVFYSGSKEDWNKISIGKVNSILTNARIHYNSSSAHSYFERIVEPTCTQDGYKLCVCECDNVYIEEHIDALGHSYKNGVCINCGKTTGGISVPDNSSVVIDKEKGLISGLDMSLDKDGLMQYLEISDDVTLTLSTDIIGTGTVITISDKATGNILETYTAVIFGDYNGDGVADIEDTGYFASIANFEIFDYFEYDYLFMAADVNGDGVVDSMDEEDMYAVANYEAYIDFTIASGSKVIRY